MNIYVGNVQYSTTEDQIRELFEQFGTVNEIKMINDRETGRYRGFSFVEMEDEAAQAAIEGLNNHDLNGRNLQINEAKERTERSERPRRFQSRR